jgi:hypothetical protein
MLDGKVMYYVADAITGKPVDKANLEYFGFRHEYVQQPPRGGFTKTVTTSFARNSDADGMVFTDNTDQPSNFNWLTIARKKGDGRGDAIVWPTLGSAVCGSAEATTPSITPRTSSR